MSGKVKWYRMKILRAKSSWSFEFLYLLYNEKERGRRFPFRKCWRTYICSYMDIFFSINLGC